MRGPITGPSNNGLERTRRVGVPASRAVVGVPPCRSTRCSAYLAVRTHLNGRAIAVGAGTGKMEPKNISREKGPDPNR